MSGGVICVDCKRSVAPSKPRIIIDEQVVCGDCAYYRETGKENPNKKNIRPLLALRRAFLSRLLPCA